MAASDRDWAKAPKKLGGEAPDAGDPVQKVFVQLKDYQNHVFGVLFVILALGILFVSLKERSQQREDQAWLELDHERNPTPEKLAPLVDKYEGTTAEPFIGLEYASKLYERGTPEDLSAAKRVLSRVIDAARGNDTVVELARKQLAGIEKELGDEKLQAALKGAGAPVGSSTVAPPAH